MEFIEAPRLMKVRLPSIFFAIIWLICADGAFCNTQVESARQNRILDSALAGYKPADFQNSSLTKPKANSRNGYSVSKFVEVEIVLSQEFTLEDVYKLSMAPGDNLHISQDSKIVTVQLPADELERLIEKGVRVTVLRRLFLIENSEVQGHSHDDEPSALGSCSGTYAYAESGLNVPIPLDGSWAGSGVTISSAPEGTLVNCVDVGYIIQHDYWSWLYVELSDSDYYFTESLYNDWCDGYISEVKTGITTFNGRDVNQLWALWARDEMFYGGGYIDYWWIKVYYEVSPYCNAGGGGNLEYIRGVAVGTINNSPTGRTVYTDYTYLSTEMQIAVGYPITVTSGYHDADDQCGIWVDWNQDYDFDDADEQIAVSGGPETYTATITPPAGAVLGDTRMRVRIMYTGTLSPCGTTDWGEVEDYTITVTAGTLSISGCIVTDGGIPMPGVPVDATNGGGSDVTDTNGFFELTCPNPYTGQLNPSKDLWLFQPLLGYIDITNDVTDANMTGTYTANPTPEISGFVTTTGGDALRDVLVSADSGQSDTTNSSGYYEFTVSGPGPIPEPWNGVVTPSKENWEFDPVATAYTNRSSDIADQNYTATYIGTPAPKISGFVQTADGIGIKDVQVATYKGYEITTTDSNGFYELTVSGPWSGWIMTGKDNWTFDPEHIRYDNVGSNIPDQNYVGSYACTEDGQGIKQKWVAIYAGPDDIDDEPKAMTADDLGNVYVTGYGTRHDYQDYVTIKYGPDGNQLWVARYDGGDDDCPKDITVDDLGNVYVTGRSIGISSGNDDYVTVKYDPNGTQVWAERYNGTGDDMDVSDAIATDSLGNVYVTGDSEGAGTGRDSVTIKYDPNGVEDWVARYNGAGSSSDGTGGIAVDNLGNVYVTGGSDGFGTDNDSITIKYDPNGDEVWAVRYNCPENKGDGTGYIALDDFGNIFVAGLTDVNYGPLITSIDYLVIKYDSQGNEIWVARYNGPADAIDIPVGMGMDGAGNVYISGTSTDHFETYYNYLTVKYGPDSNEPVWIARYDGPNRSDNVEAMAVDDLGNVYVTGYSWGEGFPPPTLFDYLTVKYGPDSNEPLWIARYDRSGCGSTDWPKVVAVDNMGNVYVTGYSPGSGTGDDFMTIKYSSCCLAADLDCSGGVDAGDLAELCKQWLRSELTADFVPSGGDGLVNFYDWAVFASVWDSNSTSPNWDPNCDICPEQGDGFVDADDFYSFVGQWLYSDIYSADIAPFPTGDGIVNGDDFVILAEQWQQGQ